MPSEPKHRAGSSASSLSSESPHCPPASGSNGRETAAKDGLDAFLGRWKAVAGEVEATLVVAIDRLGDDCPTRLREAIAYSLLAPGKRLRPILCMFTCEAVGGDSQAALGPAAALEMIHCYSLIHDDLPAMDDDDLRRGRPTCHIQFDEATAILAGDALQPLAFETILRSPLAPHAAAECCLALAQAAGSEGMVGGQMDDLLAEKRDSAAMSLDEQKHWLDAIHRRKTGAMIAASVMMGGIAGEATPQQRAALGLYGRAIGIAFQIVDDLLDVESTAENTGKATGKDSARGKLTFPTVYGIPASREQARQWVARAIDAVEPFGEAAFPLKRLAQYILDRSN
jgi:geranylgeranyl diphosphate synthase type II